MTWVYIQTEPQLWTVGFYDPAGKWHSDSDHATKEDAARHVAWLNGAAAVKTFVPTAVARNRRDR